MFTFNECPESVKFLPDSPVSANRLKAVEIEYINFEGMACTGELLVMDVVAPHVRSVFETLFRWEFPIHSLQLKANDDDKQLMEENISSAFHSRFINDSTKFSMHAYGLAIDLNPKENPVVYIGEPESEEVLVLPSNGKSFLNRKNLRKGMITSHVVELFKNHGFDIWGGNWNNPIDYHHFQVGSFGLANLLAVMPMADASLLLDFYLRNPEMLQQLRFEDQRFLILYKEYPKPFMRFFLEPEFHAGSLEENYHKLVAKLVY